LPTRIWHFSPEPFGYTPSRYSLVRRILFLAFMFSLAVYPRLTPEATEPRGPSPTTFDSIPIPDFEIGTSLPSIVLADGATTATSIIIVSPINGFTGTVSLSDPSLPAALTCAAIDPSTITNVLGHAMLSCNSSLAGTYNVTILGTSNTTRHNATATFRFATSFPPEFTLSATTPLSLTTSSTASSSVTVSSLGGFDQQVNITWTVYPTIGLSVSVNPQSFVRGSGTSTATFSSSIPGDYTVTITGTSNSVSHTTTIIVAVTLAAPPDFGISAGSNSLTLAAGNSGTTRITITPYNGFTGSIALAVSAPAGLSCDLSTITIQSSGESTLTCTCNIAGDYAVLIGASNGDNSHTTIVNVHVKAMSPVAPTPPTFPKISTWMFYIAAVLIVIIIASVATVLLLGKPKRSEVPNSQP
jgi:hypothetical protein